MFHFLKFGCRLLHLFSPYTGKSFSEALILKSINPQYDDRLFIESRVQYKKIPSSEHVVYKDCFECQNKKQCSQLGIFLYWTRDSINNLLSYCGLINLRMSASEKDLPVLGIYNFGLNVQLKQCYDLYTWFTQNEIFLRLYWEQFVNFVNWN